MNEIDRQELKFRMMKIDKEIESLKVERDRIKRLMDDYDRAEFVREVNA
jgi:hypothetical protein